MISRFLKTLGWMSLVAGLVVVTYMFTVRPVPLAAIETRPPMRMHAPESALSPSELTTQKRDELMQKALANIWRTTPSSSAEPPELLQVTAQNGQIAYVGEDGAALWLVNPDGTAARQVLTGLVNAAQPAWSHDSQALAFVAQASDGTGCVYRLNIGAAAQTILACGFTSVALPQWSPDDSRVLVFGEHDPVSGPKAWVIPAGGGQPTVLGANLTQEWMAGWVTSSSIVVPGMVATDVWQLHVITLAAPNVANPITPEFRCSDECNCGTGDDWLAYPQTSPAGDRIAFVGAYTVGNKTSCTAYYAVYTVDPAGTSAPNKIVDIADSSSGLATASFLRWAANNQSVAVGGGGSDAVMRLRIVNVTTYAQTILHGREGGAWSMWGWAPDATRLTASHAPSGGASQVYGVTPTDVWTAIAAGREPTWGLLPIQSTYTLSGKVANANNAPVSGVKITESSGRQASTNDNGEFRITGLAAGNHKLIPTKEGFIFEPPAQSVTLPPDRTGVDFRAMTVSDIQLSVLKIESTQAVQCLANRDCFGVDHRDWCPQGDCDNILPLLNDRPTLVRVYLACPTCGSPISLQGEIRPSTDAAKSLPGDRNTTVDHTTDLQTLRADLVRTLYFTLPADWPVTPSATKVKFSVTVTALDSTGRAWQIKQFESAELTYNKPSELVVRGVAVNYHPALQQPTPPDADIIAGADARLMQRIYPMDVDYGIQTLATTLEVTHAPLVYQGNEYNLLFQGLEAVRQAIVPESDRPDILVGWLPGVVNLRGPAGQVWYGVSGENVRTPIMTANASAFRTLPHEVNHTLGQGHATCGVNEWLDWPYTNSSIQEYGVDLYETDPNQQRLISRLAPDFMSYCGDSWSNDARRSWTSPYNYYQMYHSGFLPAPATAAQAEAQDLLQVSGIVYRDGTAELSRSFHIQSTPTLPEPGSGYCLDFLGSGGTVLSSTCFDITFVDPHIITLAVSRPFVWTLPYPAGTQRLVLRQGSRIMVQQLVSPHSPAVAITAPAAGGLWNGIQQVRWTASDPDGDEVTFRAAYSPDGGASWSPLSVEGRDKVLTVDTRTLEGGTDARIRVLASDGINTTTAEVSGLVVERKAPRVSIITPLTDARIPAHAPLILWGRGVDFEDGNLKDAQLLWASDRQGNLGVGSQVVVRELSYGLHVITLTGTDQDGNHTSASTTIWVGNQIYLPIIRRQ